MIERENFSEGVKSVAKFSDCEKYRYTLTRTWDENKGKIVFIGLNPSTADEMKNDPTGARMINFSKSWDYGKITVCNLFAFRATFPSDLKKAEDPIGVENDKWIRKEISDSDRVVVAWGNHGKFLSRSDFVKKYLSNSYSFGKTKQGEPRHVLYLRSDSGVMPFDKNGK